MQEALAIPSARSPSALIPEEHNGDLEGQSPEGFLARLYQARGLWAGRED
jgi:hypothetical protein